MISYIIEGVSMFTFGKNLEVDFYKKQGEI